MTAGTENDRRVVITGLGVVSPLGLTVPDMWQALVSGRCGINRITSFDVTGFKTKYAAEVNGFDPRNYVGPKEAGRMDRFTQFAVAASLEAVAAAGLRLDNGDAEETGVIIGDSICGLLQICDQLKVLSEAGPEKVRCRLHLHLPNHHKRRCLLFFHQTLKLFYHRNY